MRFVSILMLVLLLVGFASRPSVAAAFGDESALASQVPKVTVSAEPAATPLSSEGQQLAMAKCASLGILPDALLPARSEPYLGRSSPQTDVVPRSDPSEIFRPPSSVS